MAKNKPHNAFQGAIKKRSQTETICFAMTRSKRDQRETALG